MRRRGAVWRGGVVAASAVAMGAAVASEVWYFQWERAEKAPAAVRGFTLSRGRAWFWCYEFQGATTGWRKPGWTVLRDGMAEACGLSVVRGRLDWRCAKVERGTWGKGWWVDLPLWPAALIGSGASCLVILGYRRRREGCCARCGYDLAGVRGGLCPECGSARQGALT